MKACFSCRLEKSDEEFVKNKNSKDGLHHNCKMCHNAKCREWTRKNPEKRRTISRECMRRIQKSDPNRLRENDRRCYNRNKNDPIKIEARRAKNRASYARNRKKRIAKSREYQEKRILADPEYKLAKRIRTRVRGLLKGDNKSSNTEEIIGCSSKHLAYYLERKFLPGMTLQNHGHWHIDHIRPCASFDLTDFEQQRSCFHFSNLQPLWAKDNLSKGKKTP